MLTDHDYERILICASEAGISDIHITAGKPVFWRRYGDLSPLREYVPSIEDVWRLFTRTASDETRERYVDGEDVTFSWDLDQWRYRITAFHSNEKLNFSIRTLNRLIPELSDIGQPQILSDYTHEKGLVIITGSKGQGKSTTVASFLNNISQHDDMHIMTLEDSIEYRLNGRRSLCHQRTLGEDFSNYNAGISDFKNYDADILYISRFNEKNVIEKAIDLAYGGHLVIATMDSPDVMSALEELDSILDNRHMEKLSKSLRIMIAQKFANLLKGGRTPICEYITDTQSVRNLIANRNIDKIAGVINTDKNMQTFEQSLNIIGEENVRK